MTKETLNQTFAESAKGGPTEEDKIIGIRLRTLRRTAHWSQEDLGNFIGVTFQQVQKYENAANRLPLAKAAKIVNQFGLSLDYFNPAKEVSVLSFTAEQIKKPVAPVVATQDHAPS